MLSLQRPHTAHFSPGRAIKLLFRNIKSITFKVHIQLALYYLCNGFKMQPPDLQTFSDTGLQMHFLCVTTKII